jgi:Ca2+-binding EF-hand superfamily protein
MFDKDGCGSISAKDIKHMFGSNQEVSEDFWDDLIKQGDKNSDGFVNLLKVFRDIFRST